MYNLEENTYEQLKEKKRGDYYIFKEWRSHTWENPCNG
ncbi:hypothetical protein SAMN04488573_11313 [Bacillus sp. 5mfcol3.1]|nr:hypothetical protein SAMN04488573_11313 [Bacillus sp. 5mfcol3.1]